MDGDGLVLNRLFRNILQRYRARTALVYDGRAITYGELAQGACRVAQALRRCGAGPDAPVALMASNCPEYVIADLGVILAGAVKVPLNDMLAPSDIAYILADSRARIAIAGENFFKAVTAARDGSPDLETVVGLAPAGDCPEGFIDWASFQGGETEADPEVAVTPDHMAMIGYTGGTTGRSKGVIHTQRTLTLDLLAHFTEFSMRGSDRLLLTSPLPHSAGFILLAGLLAGATHLIEPRFDAQMVLERMARDRVSFLFMVPTMIYRVLDAAARGGGDFSSLRTILYGAAPITVDRLKQGLDAFGPVFEQLYGQMEAPDVLTRLSKSDHDTSPGVAHRLGSCGQAALMAEVRITDDDGRVLAPGEPGEIRARAPFVMTGYLRRPEETARALRDGWLCTGDVGAMDEDGFIYLLDRKKDMIISGGMNVYTTEVENVVQACPGVDQVAVLGLADADWGEAVTAVVIADRAQGCDEQSVLAYCRGRLASYKRPKSVRFVDALPLTPYGKLDKKALRATLGAH